MGRRSRWFPVVERSDVDLFLSLSETQQFEDLRDLRTRAAHLGGGSLAAFTALYVSIVLAVLPLFLGSIIDESGPFASAAPYITGAAVLILGLWIAYSFVLEQRDMARASARLAFYDEALQRQQHPRSRVSRET